MITDDKLISKIEAESNRPVFFRNKTLDRLLINLLLGVALALIVGISTYVLVDMARYPGEQEDNREDFYEQQ